MHYLGLGHSKLKAVHPVNYFSGFLGKNIKNCPPSKLFLFTSLVPLNSHDNSKQQNRTLSCSYICIYQIEWVNLRGHLDLFHSKWCLLFVRLLQGRSQTFKNEGRQVWLRGEQGWLTGTHKMVVLHRPLYKV